MTVNMHMTPAALTAISLPETLADSTVLNKIGSARVMITVTAISFVGASLICLQCNWADELSPVDKEWPGEHPQAVRSVSII